MTPPWPGMILPESFTPVAALEAGFEQVAGLAQHGGQALTPATTGSEAALGRSSR